MTCREKAIQQLDEELSAGASALYYRGQEIVIEDHEKGWDYVWKRPALAVRQTIETRNLEEMLDLIDSWIAERASARLPEEDAE